MRVLTAFLCLCASVSAQGTLSEPLSRANAHAQAFILDFGPLPQNPPNTFPGPSETVNNPEWWELDNEGWGEFAAKTLASIASQNGGDEKAIAVAEALVDSDETARTIQAQWDTDLDIVSIKTDDYHGAARGHYNCYIKCTAVNDGEENIIQGASGTLVLKAPDNQNNNRKFDTVVECWFGAYQYLRGTWEPADGTHADRWRIDKQVLNSSGVGIDYAKSTTQQNGPDQPIYVYGTQATGAIQATFYKLLSPTEGVTGICEVNHPDTSPDKGARINLSDTSGETMDSYGTAKITFD